MVKINKIDFTKPRNGITRVQTSITGATRTEQSHRDLVDINQIMKRFRTTKLLPQRANDGFYGDISEMEDYLSMKTKIAKAEQNFDMLPADVRKKFENKPANLLAFLEDDNNYDEAVELKILPDLPLEDRSNYVAPEPIVEPVQAPTLPGIKPEPSMGTKP